VPQAQGFPARNGAERVGEGRFAELAGQLAVEPEPELIVGRRSVSAAARVAA
jgi:hypothetical protein